MSIDNCRSSPVSPGKAASSAYRRIATMISPIRQSLGCSDSKRSRIPDIYIQNRCGDSTHPSLVPRVSTNGSPNNGP
eukprot:5560763-Karenia_brevis.AAC.1